ELSDSGCLVRPRHGNPSGGRTARRRRTEVHRHEEPRAGAGLGPVHAPVGTSNHLSHSPAPASTRGGTSVHHHVPGHAVADDLRSWAPRDYGTRTRGPNPYVRPKPAGVGSEVGTGRQ